MLRTALLLGPFLRWAVGCGTAAGCRLPPPSPTVFERETPQPASLPRHCPAGCPARRRGAPAAGQLSGWGGQGDYHHRQRWLLPHQGECVCVWGGALLECVPLSA